MPDPVGFTDAHPVDHSEAVLSDYVEQVVDHLSIWAMRLNLQVEGGLLR